MFGGDEDCEGGDWELVDWGCEDVRRGRTGGGTSSRVESLIIGFETPPSIVVLSFK